MYINEINYNEMQWENIGKSTINGYFWGKHRRYIGNMG
jgi:hypothetical protein